MNVRRTNRRALAELLVLGALSVLLVGNFPPSTAIGNEAMVAHVHPSAAKEPPAAAKPKVFRQSAASAEDRERDAKTSAASPGFVQNTLWRPSSRSVESRWQASSFFSSDEDELSDDRVSPLNPQRSSRSGKTPVLLFIPGKLPGATVAEIDEASNDFSDDTATGDEVDPQQLSATERFKRALQQRQAELIERSELLLTEDPDSNAETFTIPETPDAMSSEDLLQELAEDVPQKKKPSAQQDPGHLPPWMEADLKSSDPIRRKKARGFQKLRLQLLQVKAQFKASKTGNSSGDGRSLSAAEIAGNPDRPATDPAYQPGSAPENSTPPVHDGNHLDSNVPDEGLPENGLPDNGLPDNGVPDDGVPPGNTTDQDPAGSQSFENLENPDMPPSDNSGGSGQSMPAVSLDSTTVDGPIDRLSLADNLFAVGEFLVAMDMYEKIDPDQLTASQKVWAEYQVANCLRRMGQNAEASNRFRQIAAQPDAGWIGARSAWWISVLEQMRLAEKSIQDDLAAPATKQNLSPALPISKPLTESTHGRSGQ